MNEEIRLFRNVHGEAAILCALVEGTPDSSFPPALTEGGREPLAADLSGGHEGFRYGMLQLAASLLDVGLDDLVRRDVQHRRRAGSLAVIGALAFSGVMAASTYNALTAQRLAETNRAEAEGLVEYMITDLKTKLEPVGRLDILDGVGGKVMEYYGGQKIADMPYDRIARQARAQHLLGQVALDAGRYDEAKTQIDAAYALTKEVLARNPKDTDAIFAHAQSAFWVGKVFRDQLKFTEVRPYWQEYSDLMQRLAKIDSQNFDWIMEAAWSESSLGLVQRMTGEGNAASQSYTRSISYFDRALELSPNNQSVLSAKASTMTGAEQLALSRGLYKESLALAETSILTLEDVVKNSPANMRLRFELAQKKSHLLWQYSPLLSAEVRAELASHQISEMEALTEHDPENQPWLEAYIWHLYCSLEFTDDPQVHDKAFLSLNKFQGSQNKAPLQIRQKVLLTLISAKYAANSNDAKTTKALSKNLLSLLESDAEALANYALFIAVIYSSVGEKDLAKKYATQYLQAVRGREPSKRIDDLMREAQAQAILDDCAGARLTLSPLTKTAPDYRDDIYKRINCEA